jgi:hypothetical protein
VRRPRRTAFTVIMLVFSLLVLGGYTAMAYTQTEIGDVERETIPASVRSSPGGYRTYHFWHGGYHGGK